MGDRDREGEVLDRMTQMDTKGLLLRIFIPAAALSVSYLILGHFCKMPHILLFCILGTFILVPIELGFILSASKREYGTYSLKSAFVGQERTAWWKAFVIAFIFFGVAGLLSAFAAPVENQIFSEVRSGVLQSLPAGFDWTDYEYLKTFSRPVLVLTCIYYGVFNVIAGPVTEELFFRGYLTSHYEKQGWFTPVVISALFSLYHFWLPFNNVFRILAFTPVMYAVYRKKNFYISILFHCICNLFTTISFIWVVLG